MILIEVRPPRLTPHPTLVTRVNIAHEPRTPDIATLRQYPRQLRPGAPGCCEGGMCTVRLMRGADNDKLLTENYPRRETGLCFLMILLSYQDILSYPDPPPSL